MPIISQNYSTACFFVSQILSATAEWMQIVLFQVLVFEITHSGSAVAVLMICELAPMILIGFVAGVLVDRLDRRGIIVLSLALKTIVLAGLAWIAAISVLKPLLLCFVTVVTAALSRFQQPAANALLPSLVLRRNLQSANSAIMGAKVLGMALGPPLAAGVLAVSSPVAAILCAAGLTAAGGLALGGVAAGDRAPLDEADRGLWRALRMGVEALRGWTRGAIVLSVLLALVMGSLEVLSVVFVSKDLGLPEEQVGFLFGGYGTGMLLGLCVAVVVKLDCSRWAMAGGFGLMATAFAGTATAHSLWISTGLIALAGLGEGLILALIAMVIYKSVSHLILGRVFAIQDSAMSVTFLISVACTGVLVGNYGVRALLLAGAAILAIPALGLLFCARLLLPPRSVFGQTSTPPVNRES